MSIIKVEKTKNYTVMSNYHLREKEMSLKAKGLLSLMLSLPNNWDYSIAGLVSICKENESAIKSTLDELKTFGYLIVDKKMPNETKSGRIEYDYVVYEKSIFEKQDQEKQGVENQGVDFQGVENQGQLNINKQKTNKLNNYKYIVDFLNQKIGTNYKESSKKTQALIDARIKEGFILSDFCKVVENMYNCWAGTDFERYLRPETLFGSKFESYLNMKITKKTQKSTEARKSKERNYSKEELNSLFTKLE